MTTDELERFVFPKKVVAEIKRVAHETGEKKERKSSLPSKGTTE